MAGGAAAAAGGSQLWSSLIGTCIGGHGMDVLPSSFVRSADRMTQVRSRLDFALGSPIYTVRRPAAEGGRPGRPCSRQRELASRVSHRRTASWLATSGHPGAVRAGQRRPRSAGVAELARPVQSRGSMPDLYDYARTGLRLRAHLPTAARVHGWEEDPARVHGWEEDPPATAADRDAQLQPQVAPPAGVSMATRRRLAMKRVQHLHMAEVQRVEASKASRRAALRAERARVHRAQQEEAERAARAAEAAAATRADEAEQAERTRQHNVLCISSAAKLQSWVRGKIARRQHAERCRAAIKVFALLGGPGTVRNSVHATAAAIRLLAL